MGYGKFVGKVASLTLSAAPHVVLMAHSVVVAANQAQGSTTVAGKSFISIDRCDFFVSERSVIVFSPKLKKFSIGPSSG